MNKLSTFRYYLLRWFSQPAWDRSLYQLVTNTKPQSILEIGLSSAERTINLIRTAQRARPGAEFKYCGIDLFDARSSELKSLKLKELHCQLQKCGVKPRLMPGEFHDALPRIANALGKHDLVIITTPRNASEVAPAWFFVPRLLQDNGLVLYRDAARRDQPYRVMTPQKVASLAAEQELAQRKAA